LRRRRVRALKGLLKRACALARRREELADGALRAYLADLERRLDRLLGLTPVHPAGRKLETITAIRGNLSVFMTNREIEAANNGAERALRPGAVDRKITNGFRSEWGAKVYADLRSVIETAPSTPYASPCKAPRSQSHRDRPRRGVSNYHTGDAAQFDAGCNPIVKFSIAPNVGNCTWMLG